ncbi:MAG: hypothetical protein M3440_05290, partial [Chloroflexota bacterium]|nr:hypothetical protein [Chloroflexota bacterium]
LGYIPNPSARALVNQRVHAIALMTTDAHSSLHVPKFEDFAIAAIAAIERAAARNYNVFVPSNVAHPSPNGQDSLSSLQVDGIILQTEHFDLPLARQVIASGLPFVAVESRRHPGAGTCVATVASDHRNGGGSSGGSWLRVTMR